MRYWTLALALPLVACSFGDSDTAKANGPPTQRSFPLTDFTGIRLQGSDDVDVRVGTGFSVRAEGSADTIDRLELTRNGDTLTIGRRKAGMLGWSRTGGAKIFVTMPRIVAADIGGSGNMTVDRVEATQLTANVAGSGSLSINALRVDQAKLAIAGSGSINASGSATTLDLSVSGSGDIDAGRVKATRAQVSLAGSGDITAMVDGPAVVNLSGSGDIDLGPRAQCRTNKRGSGSVRCGG